MSPICTCHRDAATCHRHARGTRERESSEPVSAEALRYIAADDNVTSLYVPGGPVRAGDIAAELLAAREQLRLADALAESLDECACVDRYGMRSPGHCRLCAYRAARGAR